ncbi:MAG: polyphosphate polymerase domain-containing protein [Lachnospiraceae bacterium]|nr:polyphosphate polymerase domain-containing protein [Lachnospiraceae bacterium]
MKFRHEWKHEINESDISILRPRLCAAMELDAHAIDGKYEVRSLYFDNLQDKALLEKINGINLREKFRLRYYNSNTSFILLEKKSKINGLCQKEQVRLSLEEVQAVISRKSDWIQAEDKPLLQELCFKMQSQGLKPKTIVDYTREAFVYAPGNVRVTLDYNIRTGLFGTEFLDADCITIPTGYAPVILEVKWDEFLPSVIRDIVQLRGRQSTAFSKYAACRIFG